MRGHPKYKLGDKVKFQFNDEIKVGKIYIIDKYGTFQDPTDVSYDIMVDHNGVDWLFKHIPETEVIGKVK